MNHNFKPPENGSPSRDWFHKFAHVTSNAVGSPWAFVIAVLIILAWAVSGPIFRFSDTWQLVINTGTTIVTFLMVFLIQNTQNRDARAMHLKLDELIRSIHGARNKLVNLEELSDEELDQLHTEFKRLRDRTDARSGAHRALRDAEDDIPQQREERDDPEEFDRPRNRQKSSPV